MAEVELVSPFVLEYAYKRSLGAVLSEAATALRAGRILGARTASGRVLSPPQEYDPQTGEEVLGLVEVGPGGVVVSATWVEEAPAGSPFTAPFAFALIRLDGADTSLLHAVRAPRGEIRAGLRVTASWRERRQGLITDIEAFVPEGSAFATKAYDPGGEAVTRFKAPTRLDYRVTAGQVTAEFLRGILRKELNGRRCPACGKVYIPPRGACPLDGVATTEVVPLSQRGTVTTFSIIRIPFEGQVLEPPYACAHIVLDGADVPLLHIVGGVDPAALRMGMRVEAVWADVVEPTLASVRYFKPADEPDAPWESFRHHLGEG